MQPFQKYCCYNSSVRDHTVPYEQRAALNDVAEHDGSLQGATASVLNTDSEGKVKKSNGRSRKNKFSGCKQS